MTWVAYGVKKQDTIEDRIIAYGYYYSSIKHSRSDAAKYLVHKQWTLKQKGVRC